MVSAVLSDTVSHMTIIVVATTTGIVSAILSDTVSHMTMVVVAIMPCYGLF